ncbi:MULTISPECIES: hypothetical protein [Dickeya]|uniref:hypothetical protein n=1 Tax=Dickeya TaxID=204037 RepID=UPI0003A70C34|nr:MULTISPECIES: hypothetical protein [Dickeya]
MTGLSTNNNAQRMLQQWQRLPDAELTEAFDNHVLRDAVLTCVAQRCRHGKEKAHELSY